LLLSPLLVSSSLLSPLLRLSSAAPFYLFCSPLVWKPSAQVEDDDDAEHVVLDEDDDAV